YYISDIKAVSFENSRTITLEIRNAFIMGIVSDRYTALLQDAFKSVLGFDVELAFVTPKKEEEPEKPKMDEKLLPSGRYDFTFENFIKGPSNQFAYAAAQAVAANPSGAYNPLFIYGPSGLGKTHLLNAIQIEIKKNHPDYNIVYVDCETFTNDLITAIQAGRTEEFRQTYRPADVLLVDDIQFIAGKESTQEEFFHTFNTLHAAGRQIVLASDRPAKEIKSLEERLRTRFEWGLTADIQPPDFETRVAIIRRKAELFHLNMPDDVAEFIANHLKSNIRQLEGAVKKLNAYYLLEGIAPAVGVAQNAIKDILNETQPVPVTIEKIISEVARTYNVSPAEIRGMRRTANISAARQTAIYVVREITGMSMEDIGREFSGRDHSTIVYSMKAMEANLESDRRLKETVEDIIKNVRA
ncbi:MAG TPA: chromosomal replication initiator protein DnaA, partial [Candidatus Fournierella merdigallinarum]|nr:chromosomal replication initiator protein DnaA [Candidatus Fournierella merdigallinarum]